MGSVASTLWLLLPSWVPPQSSCNLEAVKYIGTAHAHWSTINFIAMKMVLIASSVRLSSSCECCHLKPFAEAARFQFVVHFRVHRQPILLRRGITFAPAQLLLGRKVLIVRRNRLSDCHTKL